MMRIKKSTAYYIIAILYLVVFVVFIVLTIWAAYNLSHAYNRGEITMSTQEEMDAVAFIAVLSVVGGVGIAVALLCLTVAVLFYAFHLEERIKELEKLVEGKE